MPNLHCAERDGQVVKGAPARLTPQLEVLVAVSSSTSSEVPAVLLLGNEFSYIQ